ncbi:hypothetical protein GPJ56_001750 [Histomonas meleagridis]|uniref:uncharacterized protein n=1 Tax=Histomonas meleagridis TaxID=135588 RepID=UPI003559E725|nr:hypothetical protein GPJ56_001750 [Histomonas meleagridis]KAH0806524.1 hypothetical protein GO595_000686 [Histomonas meleagridis]
MFIDCISKDPKILDITNTNFTRNVGVTNGALMLWGGEQHMSHIYVDNCQSTKSLAAICTSSYATATIDSSTIVNCTSNYRGSALSSFTIGTKLKVTNTKLLNNDLGKANFATFYTRNDQIKIDFIDCVIECKNFENQFGEKKKMKFLVLTNVKVIERGNNQTVINTNGMATNK